MEYWEILQWILFSGVTQKEFVNSTARWFDNDERYVRGNFEKTKWRMEIVFMKDLTENCRSFLFNKGTILTAEQIKAHHDFFLRRYNIDANPVVWNHEACLHVQRLWTLQVTFLNSDVMMRDEAKA